jgi:hypothetical protein
VCPDCKGMVKGMQKRVLKTSARNKMNKKEFVGKPV